MTIKELYEWAVENGVKDYKVELRYRDGRGEYYGSNSLCESEISVDDIRKEVML